MTSDQRQELTAELNDYRGSWVIIRGSKVIASGQDLEELKKQTPMEPGDRCLAVRARRQEPYLRI